MFEHILQIGKGDAMFAISFPRYSTRIINAVEYAKSLRRKRYNADGQRVSPIAPYADCLLTAKSDMASFVDSLVAPLSIINAVIVSISKKAGGA